MPASVLLAVLAAAGLLALAPALVRRYDATERLVAERTQSTARVLDRHRRRRTVPGRRPVRPPRTFTASLAGDTGTGRAGDLPRRRTGSGAGRREAGVAARWLRVVPRNATRPRRPGRSLRHPPVVYRRRRVFAALLLLNLVELMGVVLVSPGFWISFTVTGTLLAMYVVHLRGQALAERRRRARRAREAAWLAARQAEVRREQARRAAARREAQRRLAAQREAVRRAAMGLDRPAEELPAAANEGRRASGRGRVAGSVSYRRAGGLRGRPYEAGRDPRTG